MRSNTRWLAGGALCLVLAACGTTVPTSQQATLGGGDGLGGTTSTGSTGDGLSSTGDLNGTSSSTGDLGGTTGSSSTSGSGSTASATPGSSTAVGATTGVTVPIVPGAKPIKVGITYVKDAAAGMQAFGIQGATLGDMELYSKILVDDANKRGGLGGRKIIPVFFGYDVNPGSAGYPVQDAEACAAFTQDNHIEVGIVTFAGDDLDACLNNKHIPMVESGPTGGVGEGTLSKYRQLFVLGGLNLDRRAKEQVRALVREKYFTGWDSTNGKAGVAPVKIGIITYDLPDWTHSANGLSQAIVAAGFSKPSVIAVAAHDSYDDLAKMTPQLSNAVLSFRASGVTHVIVWDDNGVSTLFFMQQAENQKFRPRYGINSGNNMQLLSGGLVSKNQLGGSIGIGWVPTMDVADAKSNTSKYSNSARKACYALMRKHDATGSGYNEGSAMMYCAAVWAVKDRWDRMTVPSPAAFVTSFEAYGSSFIDPNVPSEYLSATQHDGLGGIYDYLYVPSCSCMRYSGSVQSLTHG